MPLYEYDCHECGQPFEELVFHTARVAEIRCPICGSADVKKRLSAVAARVAGGQPSVSAGASCSSGSL